MATDSLKNILVTGADGFLGAHLIECLKNKYTIIGLVKNSAQLIRLDPKSKKYCIVEDEKNLAHLLNKNHIDCIIHTATIYKGLPDNLSELIETNILLPIRLLQAGLQSNLKAFINTDSFFNDDRFKYDYLCDYTLSKKQINEWLKFFINKFIIINIKLQHIYGPGDSDSKFVPSLINDLILGVPFITSTLGEQKRDFIFIKDVVSAYEIILDNFENFSKTNFKVWEANIGTGKSLTLKEFIDLTLTLTGSKTEIKYGSIPYRKGEIMDSFAPSGLLGELGWAPIFSLEQGLKETIEFHMKKKINGNESRYNPS